MPDHVFSLVNGSFCKANMGARQGMPQDPLDLRVSNFETDRPFDPRVRNLVEFDKHRGPTMAAPGPATHLTYATAPSFAADPMWGVVNRFADEGGDETMADAGQGNAAGQGSSSASAAVPAQSAQMVQEPEGEVDGESDSDSESGGSSGSDWGNRKKSGVSWPPRQTRDSFFPHAR